MAGCSALLKYWHRIRSIDSATMKGLGCPALLPLILYNIIGGKTLCCFVVAKQSCTKAGVPIIMAHVGVVAVVENSSLLIRDLFFPSECISVKVFFFYSFFLTKIL